MHFKLIDIDYWLSTYSKPMKISIYVVAADENKDTLLAGPESSITKKLAKPTLGLEQKLLITFL